MHTAPPESKNRAFTLIELITVMAIMVLLMVMVVPAMTGLKSAGEVTKAAFDFTGLLDSARAYAIAHEVGHHVQHLMGTFDKVRQVQTRADQGTANRLSVRIELQADCFAGVWGHHTAERGIIHQQDVTTALQTAARSKLFPVNFPNG